MESTLIGKIVNVYFKDGRHMFGELLDLQANFIRLKFADAKEQIITFAEIGNIKERVER